MLAWCLGEMCIVTVGRRDVLQSRAHTMETCEATISRMCNTFPYMEENSSQQVHLVSLASVPLQAGDYLDSDWLSMVLW